MWNVRRLTSASMLAGALALGIGTTPATAQLVVQRGLVNVVVFDVIENIVIRDINVGVGVAANIAANVCGVTVPVAVLSQQVVLGAEEFTCSNDAGDTSVTISQQ